jgi:hypothetical protein
LVAISRLTNCWFLKSIGSSSAIVSSATEGEIDGEMLGLAE